ncbi:MAG: penicillin-binding protein 2, partial [Methylobacterium sp.]
MIDLRKLVPARARPQAAPALGLKPRRVEAPRNKARFAIATALFCSVYLVIGGRLVMWGAVADPNDTYRAASGAGPITRPDLVDRNGEVLATDIKTASLFAEPKRIVDADEATESLLTVLPDLNPKVLHARLSSKAGFAWLKRELTP